MGWVGMGGLLYSLWEYVVVICRYGGVWTERGAVRALLDLEIWIYVLMSRMTHTESFRPHLSSCKRGKKKGY